MIHGKTVDQLLEAVCRIKGCAGRVKPCSEPGLGGLCADHLERQRERERHTGEFERTIRRTLRPANQRTFDLWNIGPTRPEYSNESAIDLGSVLITLLEADEGEEWIGVDLDGTLAKYTGYKGPTKIGEIIPAMAARVRRWVGHGKKVKIFTARADDEKAVNAIKKWLKDNELPDLEVTNLKDRFMTELWDDRAVGVVKNTGEVKEATSDSDAIIHHLLGEAYVDWSPDWEPGPEILDWFRELLQHMIATGKNGWESRLHIYLFDAEAKTFTLVAGNPHDPLHWHDKNKVTLGKLGYRVLDQPANPEETSLAEAWLQESPTISTLEKHRVDLEPEERQQIMKAKAVWPFGKKGADSPAIHKAVVNGKTWYWSNTHRLGQVRPTIKSAIKAFHAIVEPSA